MERIIHHIKKLNSFLNRMQTSSSKPTSIFETIPNSLPHQIIYPLAFEKVIHKTDYRTQVIIILKDKINKQAKCGKVQWFQRGFFPFMRRKYINSNEVCKK